MVSKVVVSYQETFCIIFYLPVELVIGCFVVVEILLQFI